MDATDYVLTDLPRIGVGDVLLFVLSYTLIQLERSLAILISRISVSVAEALVIVVTWRNRVRGLKENQPRGETLGSILLRDGA